jgi:hypothetical protein
MSLPDLTTVIAVDPPRLEQLRWSWPTWEVNCPQIARSLLAFCDGVESVGWWNRQLHKIVPASTALKVVIWPMRHDISQRHRMLSAFVYGVAEHCETGWYWKIDTDVTCVKPTELWPGWFCPRRRFVLVGNAWGYTKSQAMWQRLVEWADQQPALRDRPAVPAELSTTHDHVLHERISSYVMLGRTRFLREVRAMAPGPVLPIESQDTFLWYMAQRLERPYLRVNMGRLGWTFRGSLHQRAREALA